MAQSQAREFVGVLGGMGPIASVDSFIVGCSEVHLIAKQLNGCDSLDPFSIIAQHLAEIGS